MNRRRPLGFISRKSTPPRGRRLQCRRRVARHNGFNPRLRAGGDVACYEDPGNATVFQSTPPRGRRPAGSRRAQARQRFNPRLRAGGDRIQMEQSFGPTEFQSTPPRGRRRGSGEIDESSDKFQSTPPRGRRRISEGELIIRLCFNPRLRAGGDAASSRGMTARFEFQSTPPRGRRPPRRSPIHCRSSGFNPRLRAGGDPAADREARGVLVSIHASAREATLRAAAPS